MPIRTLALHGLEALPARSASAAISGNSGSSKSWSKLPANTVLAGQPSPASTARQAAGLALPKIVRANAISAPTLANSTSRQNSVIAWSALTPPSPMARCARIADEALRVFIRCEAY